MKEKFCKGCEVVLPIENFTKSKNVKDGFENKCRLCRQKQRKSNNKLTCVECDKKFSSAKPNTKYCSYECMGKSKQRTVTLICKECQSEYQKIPSLQHISKFCSIKCRNEHDKHAMLGKKNHNYNRIETKCDGCNSTIKVIPFDFERLKHNFCSFECYKENIGRFKTGPNNYNYNPSISMEERIIGRMYTEYGMWRKKVYERDSYSCKLCGNSTSGNLNAHHLDGYNWCKDKRTDINNGVTLCTQCHNGFHKIYGFGDNTKQQFIEYYNNYNKLIMSQA